MGANAPFVRLGPVAKEAIDRSSDTSYYDDVKATGGSLIDGVEAAGTRVLNDLETAVFGSVELGAGLTLALLVGVAYVVTSPEVNQTFRSSTSFRFGG